MFQSLKSVSVHHRRAASAAVLAGTVLLLPAVAQAHAHLKSATPAVGGTVNGSPQEIRIIFTEGVEPKFTGVSVADAGGKEITMPAGNTDPGDAKIFIVPVTARLAPGTYKVHWHALAVDTHKSEGDFSFTVAP